jgi:hypothetical protein
MKGIGKIDTEELLMIGGAAALVYFMTRQQSVTPIQYPYGYPQQQQSALNTVTNNGNSTSSIISAGSQLVSSLASMISSF